MRFGTLAVRFGFDTVTALSPNSQTPCFEKKKFANAHNKVQNWMSCCSWTTHGFQSGYPDIVTIEIWPYDRSRPIQLENRQLWIEPTFARRSCADSNDDPTLLVSAVQTPQAQISLKGRRHYPVGDVKQKDQKGFLICVYDKSLVVQAFKFKISLEDNASNPDQSFRFDSLLRVGIGATTAWGTLGFALLRRNVEANWRYLDAPSFKLRHPLKQTSVVLPCADAELEVQVSPVLKSTDKFSAVPGLFTIIVNEDNPNPERTQVYNFMKVFIEALWYDGIESNPGPSLAIQETTSDWEVLQHKANAVQFVREFHAGQMLPPKDSYDQWMIGVAKEHLTEKRDRVKIFKLRVSMSVGYHDPGEDFTRADARAP
ncbi:hypothetical protein T439DRAFT_327924, partial [Meredithblackwellia eburnea MCA 4105]